MDERQGRLLLHERFTAAGLRIQEDYPYSDGTVAFSLDGYDPQARVGYEYITTAAGDREELPPAVLRHLEERMGRGEVAILLIDELDVDAPEALQRAATRFLKVALRGHGQVAR